MATGTINGTEPTIMAVVVIDPAIILYSSVRLLVGHGPGLTVGQDRAVVFSEKPEHKADSGEYQNENIVAVHYQLFLFPKIVVYVFNVKLRAGHHGAYAFISTEHNISHPNFARPTGRKEKRVRASCVSRFVKYSAPVAIA
ncbi:MAG: hypothetical protein WED00_15930 [Aquisalimonadaceae bacterium]